MAKTYDENSIVKLDARTFTRTRPDVYLGSSQHSTQLVKEIVSNSVDEAIAGNCTKIRVEIDYKKNQIQVDDNGQGILPDVWKGEHTVLEMVYGDINTSGKYEHSEDSAYRISTGAFGIGGALANWLSKHFDVTTIRDGKYEHVYFEDGLFVKRDVGTCPEFEHGVSVSFKPDPQFFKYDRPNENELVDYLRDVVCLVPNLVIEYNGRTFRSVNGISDILESWSHEGSDLTPKRFKCEFEDVANNRHMYCAAMFRDTSEAVFSAFCNYAPIEGGTPLTAVKTVITKVFNSWGQENGILKENEKLSGNAIQEGIVFAFNLVSNDIRYDSQTKVRVTSTTDNDFITTNLTSALTKWLNDNPQQSKALIEKSVIAKRAAEAAKRARDAIKGKKKGKEKIFKAPTKLTDCWTKDRKKAELILCEGLSAASSLVSARDSQYQAVYGVRGKMLSVLKATPTKILENQEINNIVQALGLDVDPKTAKMTYDLKKLRYNKIIANCDADFDGFAIKNLMFNILWYMCPELIIRGHVYAAIPPLFRVTTNKNEYVYLRDETALDDYKKAHKNIKTINRMKGIGEMDPEEVASTLMNPATRNIVQLTVSDKDAIDRLMNDLYGKDVKPRVDFLLKHAEEADVG